MTLSRSFRCGAVIAAGLIAVPPIALAQQTEVPKVVAPAFDFSGIILGNFRYTYDDATKNANGGQATNKFDVERVYLNFRMPAGEDGSIRVTTDVFNNTTPATNGYYLGWTIRLKYGFFQYNFLHDIGGMKGFNAVARVGMLNTIEIDNEEQFWPRYLSQTPIERSGFYSSSDVGIASQVTLPNKMGEVYATMLNGSGYAAAENDPYKDYAARVSLTPFGNEASVLKTFTIAPWYSAGHAASKFLAGGAGQVGPVTDGLKRNRGGVFVGLRDRRLTVGVDVAQRTETVESGANTATSPRTTVDNNGTLTAAWAVVRPIELVAGDPKAKSPFGIVVRVDNFTPYSQQSVAGPTTGTQTTRSANQLIIAGVFYDLNSKAPFALDFQNLKPQSGSTIVETKVLFAHMQISF
jgi:hypothetical protein